MISQNGKRFILGPGGTMTVAPDSEQCHYRLTVAHEEGNRLIAHASTTQLLMQLQGQLQNMGYHLVTLERINGRI